MKNLSLQTNRFSLPKKRLFQILALLLFGAIALLFPACKKETDYFSYVSELRGNILLAKTETLSLRAYAVQKEIPYETDGIARETSTRAEIYLSAPSGDKTCNLSFTVAEKTYGGEMSYDNVKAEYYYSCALDIFSLSELSFEVEYGEEKTTLQAVSVKTENTLSPQAVLEHLRKTEADLFESMTDKYGFAGEIYLRLLYEDAPYYYVGVIDKNGKTTAYLLNAETGKILAKRQS